MTSTNDGKEVKSNQTSGPKGKTYYIELYKSLEAGLSGDCELRERTQHLCEAWRRIYSLCQHSASTTHPHLLSWLQRHTARTVLQTEWQSPKSNDDHKSLEEAINAFVKECENWPGTSREAGPPPWETQLLARGEWFKRILANPWGHPVLRVLLDPRGEPPSEQEVLEWLKEERGVMFVTRLRQLAASKCDDLALSLSSAVMDRVRACVEPPSDTDVEQNADIKAKPQSEKKPTFEDILKTEAGFTVDVWELLIDMEFVLLYKRDKRSRCIELAKQTPLRSGYQLVERLQSRLETSPREKKLWKNAKEVATLIAQVVITRCMVVPVCSGTSRTALYCCARSLVRVLGPRLPAAARALAAPAATARHLHTLAAAVDAQSTKDLKPFVCELYVRAITAGMNELERLKLKTEKEEEARSAEQTLSSWFTQLGALLSASERIRCECTLTAFSMHPTPAMFERIKAAPVLPPLALDVHETKEEPKSDFGSWANDSRSQTNFVKTSETLNLKHTQHQANVLSTAIFSEGETLGISPELCQDIAVLLSGPRLKTLSWDTDREALLEKCQAYMERTNFGTRSVTTELKYLNLDPRQYQHLPEEEEDDTDMYYGIEKGYEHHLAEYQEPEEIWQDADDPERTESASSSDIDQEIVRKTKKKNKKILSSEDDSDPLSLVAEAKRVEKKKERPHSKERSKELKRSKSKSKPKDPLEINDPTSEKKKEPKKKEKRERKRKEKPVPTEGNRSLSNLIGMKVTNVRPKRPDLGLKTPSVSDSDYDSQGKCSVVSEGNETDVLFDGLFSMDELKSPERSPDKIGLMRNIEHHVSTGAAAVSTPSVINSIDTQSRNNAPVYRVPNVSKSRTSSPSNQTHPLVQGKMTTINEDVKKSISKLIQFRRQRTQSESEQILQLQPNVVHKYSYQPGSDSPTITPQTPVPPVSQISPKAIDVKTSHSPKVYMNKTQSEQLAELKNEVNNLLCSKTFGIARPVIQYSPKTNNSLHNNSLTDGIRPPNPNSQRLMQDTYRMPQIKPNQTVVSNESKVTPSRPSASRRTPIESPNRQNFHVFLKELQESINAGAGGDTRIKTGKKEIKPISRVIPVQPAIKTEPKSYPQCAKQHQKKSENLNTFSRLSYLHKNKMDVKSKELVNALIEFQSKKLQNHPPLDVELNKMIQDQKNLKSKHLQSRSNSSAARADTSAHNSQDNTQSLLRKIEKPKYLNSARENPIMANILTSATVKTEDPHKNVKVERGRDVSMVSNKFSSLTERDHEDLLILLRQQSKMNQPQTNVDFKEKPRPPHTITSSMLCTSQSSTKIKTTGPSSAVHSNNRHNIGTSPNIKPSNSNDERMPNNAIQTNATQSNATQSNATHTKALNMIKTELNCSKAVDPKSKKIQILNDILIKSNKQKSVCATKTSTEKDGTDWQKVMDAIRSHKTPSRGPNALDMALNKDSYNTALSENLQNQRIIRTNSTGDPIMISNEPTKRQTTLAVNASPTQSRTTPTILNRSKSESVIKTNKNKSTTKQEVVQRPQTNKATVLHANTNLSRPIQPETPRLQIQTEKRTNHALKDQVDVLKKIPNKHQEKQFTCPYYKEEDPFISGIPNSDYDLLEELMDDDLRQEIGELSSDEDSYRAPMQSLKDDKNYIISKPITPMIKKEEKGLQPSVINTTSVYKKPVQKLKCDITKTAFEPAIQGPSGIANMKTVIKSAEDNSIDAASVHQTKVVQPAKVVQPTKVVQPAEVVQPIQVHQPAKVIQPTNVVQPTHAVHRLPQTVIAPHRNSNGHSFNNANLLRTVGQTNSFVPAGPQQTALKNVVVIGSDIVYQPCTETMIRAAPVAQKTYLAFNNQPNMSIYQTTQFAAPDLNPLIIGNAVTVPVSKTPLNESTTAITKRSEMDNHTLKNQEELKNKVIQNRTINLDCNDIKADPKSSLLKTKNPDQKKFYINSNKNCERKVLSEVHEKQKNALGEKIDPKPAKSLPRNSFDRDTKNEALKDQERLKNKRLAILNRTICHRSDNEAIPLTYAPLTIVKVDLNLVKDNKTNENFITTSNSKSSKLESLVNIKVRPAENSVETKENKDSCRRILLRSCNKVIEVNSEVVKKIAIPKKTEVRLKPTPIESASNGTDEDLNRELKINKKRILGKKVNKRIKKLNTNKKGIKSLSKRNVQKTETTLGKETEPNPAKAETCKQMSDFLDLEDEIVNSVILKTVPLDQSSMPARKFDQIQENDSDNHIMKEFNGDYRSSQNILDKDVSENPVLQNESLEYTKTDASVIPQDIKMNRGDINIKDDTNAKISENQNELNKQNMKNTTVVKEIESYIKRLENMKPHKIGTAVNELYIFNSKDSKEAHQKFLLQPNRQTTKVPVKSITRSTTEVNKITAKNLDKTEDKRNDQGSTTEVKKSVANNLDKTDTDELEVICLDGDDNDKQSINKNKEMRKELSIKNKVLNKVTGKSNEENKKLKINDKIPQSLMDAITIEDLPHLNTGDPLQKCVRIKLPSGRVFKATVHGQMNVDTNTLFADPALKSVLLSNVSRNKRYTLNIKQLSTTSKSQPDKIIESHIQEIQLASNTFNRRAVEIIDLLSDSDEESDNFNFNTEYGKFKVGTMKRKLHEVYQRSFDKKCVVKLKRISQHGGEFKENFQTYLTISPKEDTNQETETLASNVSGTDIPSIEPLRPEEKEKDATLEIVVPTDVQTVDSVGQPDNQSVVPPDVHPIYQPVVEPSTLLTKQSIIQPDIPVISVVEPSDQSVMQPSVQSVDEPSVQAVVQPAIQCIVQSNVQSVLQPIHQPVIQPVLQPSDQPVMEPIVQSVIQPDIQHVVQPVVQPVRKSIVRLDTRDVQQVNQPSNQPSTVSEMNKPKSTQNEPEIIEIDDSSNDETDLIIPDLTKNITTVHIPLAEQLSDSVTVQEKFTAVVPVENIESVEAQEKINEFRNLLFRDLGIEDIGDKSSQSEGMTASVSLTNDIDPAVSKDTSTQIPTPSNCFVKLSKCDDLLRRYKTLKLLKECFVRLVRCDESYQREKQTPTAEMNGENTNDDEIIDIHETSFDTATDVQPLSRCGSFSILTDYEILENLQTVGEITRSSSPVMEAYETIALLIGKNAFQKEYCETLTCEADWFLTKSKFHWLYKDIAIQDHEDDRYKAKVQDKHNFDSHATLSPSLESSLILPSYLHMAPLKTLVLKFFQNNPFIDHLKSPRLETKCTMDGIKPNLKRKSRNAVRMTNKISKMCENLLLEPRTDAFDRKDLATHEEVVKDSELICNTENDLEIVQECNDVNEKAMDVSEVYLEPQSFEKVISAMEGISTVESTSTEENILSVASIPIIGSILTEESIRTVKSIPTEESNPTEESIPNMESIPLESTLILDSITTVDSIPTIESIVDSISTVESIPIVESTSIVESIASVTTIPTIESISTVDSQNDDVHTKVNTNTDEQLEHDRASSSANSLIELASFSTSVGDDSEDVSVSILHDPHPDSTQTEFYNEKPQFEVDADAILNVTEAIIETIYDNTNTIPEIENVCKETDNVTVVVDLDKENTCRQDCLTPTADKLDVENMSEDDDIITVVTDLDVNSMFCKKQIEFICNDDVNNTTSVNEPDLENKAENDCKTICKDTQNEETEPALEKNSADDCENISEYCEIITVVTDLDVNSMFCENSCEERDTPSGVEFVKENISVTIDKDCFIQPEETDNIAEMSDMNIDLNNSKEKHDDTRNDANTQHENEEFGNTVPEIDEVVQENTEKLSGADKIPVDTEMVIEDTFKQINENIDQHIEIPDMTDFDIEVICEEVSEEIVKDAVKMSTEENMVLETYCAEQIEHMSNDSNKILEGTDIYKEVIDKINDDEIRNICEDSFPVFKTFEVNTVKITKEIIDINTNSEIQKATIEVLNTDDAVILDSENNPSEESGIEINHVHRVLTVCTNTNHKLIDTGDDNILNTDNVTLDREDIDSEGSDIQVNDMDRVTTNKSTNSDNLEGITETQYENKEISNISDTSDDHINNKTIILDNENTPITHDLVVNKVVLNQENYSPAVCNNEEESTKDFIKSNKNSLPEVNKINDHFLEDENCDSVEVIVDVCSDDLDQELARTVFTNVTSPVEGAPTQEPVLPVNTEAAQIESQSVELIQKENTTSETFDNIDLHSSVVECIEYEDENMESNPIIEETCEDEGDVKPEETEQQAEEISEIEEIDLKLNIPKITYAKYSPKGSGASYLIIDKKNRKNLKRKAEMADFQFSCGKKYRKGKNIDYPKITPANMSGSAYSKEYKRLLDYCSSVKFSYSRPFHKECIDVHDTLTAWPIKGTCNVQESETEKDQTLFGNTETVLNNINDPSKQTLAEEIVAEYNELDYSSSDVIETNFKMGFGEGSGRVIQNLEDGCGTKFSAATLSDVKHTQPVLQSENYDNCKRVLNQNPTNDYEIEKLQRNIKCIQMKNKVRSFFKQTMAELSYDCIKQQEKEDVTHSKNLFHLNYECGLYGQDYIQPPPFEAIVQVVQVGQLPVSAAAQNPVTCDPRVTQVSNASPSQCSVENSPGDDSQSVIKTEYTELTTADLSMPLPHEYVQHIQSMPISTHEGMNYPMTSEPYNIDVDIKPEIKIEMEETPEIKEEINDNYENNEYPPLFEKNIMNNVDYSYETNPTRMAPEVNSNMGIIYNYAEKQSVTETFPHIKPQEQEQLQLHEEIQQQQQQQQQLRQQLQHQEQKQQDQHQQQQQLQQEQEEYQQLQKQLEQEQLRQQQQYQQQQIQLQQQQLEQEQRKLQEMREQQLKQQQLQEQQQQQLKELKLKQQKQQQQELKLQQQRQRELKQQQQRELKQQQQRELKQQQQQKQLELKQQQQKQQELKQQQQQQQQQERKQRQLQQQQLKQQKRQQQELQQQQKKQLLEQKKQQLEQQKKQQLEQQKKQQLEQQKKQQLEQQKKQQLEQQKKQQLEQQKQKQLEQQHQQKQQQQQMQLQQQQQQLQQQQQQNVSQDKSDQIAHAMNAAGISAAADSLTNNRAQALVNMLSQKLRQNTAGTGQTAPNYQKTTAINAMALQQALAQILPPPLNQTNATENNQQTSNAQVTPQVLHIVQGKSASGNHQQITLVDNSQQAVINTPNATPVLHIVQNKTAPPGPTSNGTPAPQTNSFSGLSLVDAGLQQGNQLLHIVNTGGQKNTNTGQLLKRVNLLTNLTNVQGGSEQKMVQFVCKSADGKPLQLNGPHQRSMVLRLQPVDTPNLQPTQPKQMESQDLSPTHSAVDNINSKDADIKSRSIYEENYAKFIQGSSPKSTVPEKGTSLPKFNQAFGKQGYQDGSQKDEISNSNSHLSPNGEHTDCQPNDNAINLEHISHIGSPPLLMRKPSISQAQTNLVQQLKQTISPMNIHGGVIYTRQIPVNIGGGQTINLITVPNTDLIDDSNQTKQQGEIEPSIIKIVPQTQTSSNSDTSDENNSHIGSGNENSHTPQPQPVLTQMRIKLPMLSKAPQMVSGGRVVRPSFFQIQRNVIGGANQPVYQQLVLTAAPPLGQQTIRPQTQTSRPVKTPSESQSSTESMSSSTLEQLREFDLVLEQVKERSTVQPNATSKTTFPSKKHTPSTDTTNAPASTSSAPAERSHLQPAPHKHHQVLYSIGNTQPLNVAYVNKKASARTPATSTTSSFVRSPDSSGIVDSSPTSSTQAQIPHTVTSEPTPSTSDAPPQAKPPKPSSKSKSRPKASSNLPNTLKLNTVPPKTSSQKPAEDEQTTQRILYILAEYKEQVENSPDKDKPAPRRRTNLPSNSGSSKRRKSYRRGRDISPIDDSCRTMGSEDSSCGTSQGDCNESCMDSHSPQDSPRKVSRKLTFEQETPVARPRPQPARNVIVADGQRIAVARSTTSGKPSTTVLMPTNYILPVSMIKGGQQIAIVTNRGPKLLTVAGGEGGATNALLLQRLIGPAGLKPVLTRPGVRHIRLPTAALHNLQAFNLTTSTVQPPDSTASPAPAPTPPDLIDTRANSSPWRDRDGQEVKPERGSSSPEGSEPWHLPASANPHDYSYEEVVRTDNMDRTVLDPIPDRYSPDMEAQRIFDKMFDVDSKKSYMVGSHDDSPRCGYDIDASDCDDKAYHQVVQRKDGSNHRQHRLTHVSAAALRHKYAILEHELRLQKSLSEECEDLGVDSPSASDLFPEAELLFATSPAHEHTQDHGHHSHTPQPLLHHSSIPQPDIDDQIATDQLLPRPDMHDDRSDLGMGLEDVGIVTVSEDGMQATIALDQEEFARSHPNTTFHSEPTDEGEVQPFTISGLKGRHITSTIFHANRAPGTVLMTAPQATVISQATAESSGVQNPVKYSDIDNMINSLPGHHNHTNNMNMSSVLVKDDGLTRFDGILHDNRELHLSHTASAIVHPTGSNTTQVIRRVCYGNKREQASRYLMHESGGLMASEEAKIMTEDSRDFGDADDDRSSPERAELFWESNSASERESRRHLDFSSDSDKCCKSPSFEENNSTDSSGVGAHMRLDSVIKEARRASADGSSADDTHPPPLRTYPPKRPQHAQHAQNAQHAQHVQHAQHIQHSQVPQHGQHGQHGQVAGGVGAVGTGGVGGAARSLSGKTRAGERSHSPLAHSPLAHSPLAHSGRRRASGRGVVKRGCHCCNGSPAPPRPKKPRQRTQH